MQTLFKTATNGFKRLTFLRVFKSIGKKFKNLNVKIKNPKNANKIEKVVTAVEDIENSLRN